MNSTPKDRVKARYPGAVAVMGRFDTGGGKWRIQASEGRPARLMLGRGSSAARAWKDAAARLREL